jgi:hypothetical protein
MYLSTAGRVDVLATRVVQSAALSVHGSSGGALGPALDQQHAAAVAAGLLLPVAVVASSSCSCDRDAGRDSPPLASAAAIESDSTPGMAAVVALASAAVQGGDAVPFSRGASSASTTSKREARTIGKQRTELEDLMQSLGRSNVDKDDDLNHRSVSGGGDDDVTTAADISTKSLLKKEKKKTPKKQQVVVGNAYKSQSTVASVLRDLHSDSNSDDANDDDSGQHRPYTASMAGVEERAATSNTKTADIHSSQQAASLDVDLNLAEPSSATAAASAESEDEDDFGCGDSSTWLGLVDDNHLPVGMVSSSSVRREL